MKFHQIEVPSHIIWEEMLDMKRPQEKEAIYKVILTAYTTLMPLL